MWKWHGLFVSWHIGRGWIPIWSCPVGRLESLRDAISWKIQTSKLTNLDTLSRCSIILTHASVILFKFCESWRTIELFALALHQEVRNSEGLHMLETENRKQKRLLFACYLLVPLDAIGRVWKTVFFFASFFLSFFAVFSFVFFLFWGSTCRMYLFAVERVAQTHETQ